ncbi:MaoC family dehydratase N-terminal domain-containing protein [Pseudonocardia sp. WMMC193]|uniref:FAS1-like dehydratase domain-containing protein n=1 Tax=Pseudonocardia sp. WMMC193 TaxID=2911965 RepID=UPI001F423CA1|nr:MaoC family dehydratase N-terminal domain-containing protein [Pseudonocardia sp. WMMC193]MCF7550893.1 MaoC family dehydratase N-terminal domain-containing protein [Pseudonocardia sp. WMMC193]
MDESAKGRTLVEVDLTLTPEVLGRLTAALGGASGRGTETLVPSFAATVGGESTVVDGLGLDLSRALLGGLGYEWARPFTPGETVHVRVVVEDVYSKGANQFGVVGAEYTAADGALVQRQSITFVERGVRS